MRLVLELKGLAYENHPLHLVRDGGAQRTDTYRGMNPMMQVPMLEWTDGDRVRRLTQSVAICEFLDERHPAPPLLPGEPETRARVREIVETINSGIQPLQNLRVLQELTAAGLDRGEWSARWIQRGFEALETRLRETAADYCVGGQITLADVFLVPQIYNARRFHVDLAPFATICRIESACSAVPAFQAAHPDRQPDAQPPAS